MTSSAQRARRLVSGGWVLLATPAVWLVAASLLLWARPVSVLAPLVWLLTVLWVGNLLLGVIGTKRRRPRRDDLPHEDEAGVVVSADEQPELWQLVRDAAGVSGLRPPDELRLTAVGHVVAWPRRRTRLDLGVPVLFVLDPGAVGAMVARALAEAETGWTDAAEPVDRFRWMLRGLAGRQLPGGLARMLLRRLDRQRAEGLLEVDDLATRVAGRPTVGRGLAWSHVVHAATLWWFDEYVLPEALAGRRPEPLLPGLEAFLADPVRQRQLMQVVAQGLPTGDGAIPGLADRVYGLQTGAEVPDLLPGAPSADLLREPQALLQELADVTVGSGAAARDWPDVLDSWAVRTSRTSAAILADHGSQHGSHLSALLDGVAEGRLLEWVEAAAGGADVDTRAVGHFLLTGLLADALVASGAGRMCAGWSGSIDVVGRDGVLLDVPRAARLVVDDPTLVPELRALLTQLGVRHDHHPATEGRSGSPLLTFRRTSGPRHVPGSGFPGLVAPS